MRNERKFYYDTNSFWRFFINEYVEKSKIHNDIKLYSPLNNQIQVTRIISPWTIEEFFHSFITTKSQEITDEIRFPKKFKFPTNFFEKEIKKRTEVLTNVKSFLYLFSQENIDSRRINELFLSLIFAARESDILHLKKKDKKIHSKDLLHVAYALSANCQTLITCDEGFRLLKDVDIIKRLLSEYKLHEVVILNQPLTKIECKIDFS